MHGWRGVNCDFNIDPCLEPRETLRFGLPWDNRGYVDDYSTSADNCDPVNAYCIHTGPALFECDCNPGYESNNGGVLCTEIDECLSHPCQNNATCMDLLDTDGDCPTCFEGYNCSCDVGVGGIYEKGLYSGFEGFNCEINIDECLSSPCVRGNCSDRIAAYHCTCPGGWEGHNCNEDIDECRSSPCMPRTSTACDDSTSKGLHRHPIDAYTCTCVPGWEGGECQSPTPSPPLPPPQTPGYFELILAMSIYSVPRRAFFAEKPDWIDFRDELEAEVAAVLGINASRVALWEVLAGSVIATFQVDMSDLAYLPEACLEEGPHCRLPWEWSDPIPGSPPPAHPAYTAVSAGVGSGTVARYVTASALDEDSPTNAMARMAAAVAAGLRENHRCPRSGEWTCAEPLQLVGVDVLGYTQKYNLTEPEPEPEPEPQPEPEPEPEPPEPTWLESFFCDEPYTQGWPDVPARRVCNAGAVAITVGLFFCAVFMALSIVCVVRRRMGQVLKVHPAEFDRPDSRDRPVTPVVEPQRPGPPSGKNNNTRRAKQYMIANSPAAGSPGRKPRTP